MNKRLRDVALAFALTHDQKYAQFVRAELLRSAHKYAEQPSSLDYFTGGMAGINLAWSYDLIYGELSADDRSQLEAFFHQWGMAGKAAFSTGARATDLINIPMWARAFITVAGYTTGSCDFVEFGVRRQCARRLQGGAGHTIKDHALWNEATAYQLKCVTSSFAAIAEAALHYDGTDLYRWQSPNGNSFKDLFDSPIEITFPHDLRLATYGDYSSESAIVSEEAANTTHQVGDWFLINDSDARDWNKYDLAYRRYKDPAYAWILSQNPRRDEYDSALFDLLVLTHRDALSAVTPPDAKSHVFPESGFAILRAQEGPAYWSSTAPAVSIRFGPRINHGHSDSFHITLEGSGTLLEPDWFIQWDYQNRHGRNPTPWSYSSLAHNTVTGDRKSMPPQREPLQVEEKDFGSRVKVLRVAGQAYPGVLQSRTLALTADYMLDIFDNVSDEEHIYDWVLHGLGALEVKNQRFAPYDVRTDMSFAVLDAKYPQNTEMNQWIRNGMRADASGEIQMEWRQENQSGVRVTLLGHPGTTLLKGDGPYYVESDGMDSKPADGRIRAVPLAIARRKDRHATFVAVHQPLRNGKRGNLNVRELPTGPGERVIAISSPTFTDYFLFARDTAAEHTLTCPAGKFRFRGSYGFVRRSASGRIETQGQIIR